ncbi:MAG: hypothetical protein AAFN81_01260 [Bacteroidota bacterium]
MLLSLPNQPIFKKALVPLLLLVFSNRAYLQESQLFLVDMDFVITHSVLDSIRQDLRDTFYHKNYDQLDEEVKQFQREISDYHRHNCCGCTLEVQQRQIDRLKGMQEHLMEQEAGLLRIDSLLELQFKAFAFELCAELMDPYMKRYAIKGLVLDASQLEVLSSLGVGYLTEEVIQLVDTTDLLNIRLKAFEQSFVEVVKEYFKEE